MYKQHLRQTRHIYGDIQGVFLPFQVLGVDKITVTRGAGFSQIKMRISNPYNKQVRISNPHQQGLYLHTMRKRTQKKKAVN